MHEAAREAEFDVEVGEVDRDAAAQALSEWANVEINTFDHFLYNVNNMKIAGKRNISCCYKNGSNLETTF